MTEYKTKLGGRWGGYTANVNPGDLRGGMYSGTVTMENGSVIDWKWHADGRSIDRHDSGFDLIDFPQSAAIAETVTADG